MVGELLGGSKGWIKTYKVDETIDDVSCENDEEIYDSVAYEHLHHPILQQMGFVWSAG